MVISRQCRREGMLGTTFCRTSGFFRAADSLSMPWIRDTHSSCVKGQVSDTLPTWHKTYTVEELWRRLLHVTGMKCGLCTRRLTPRRRVLLQKLIVPRLVKSLSLPRLWKPKVYYRAHKSPPLVPNLSHIRDILASKDRVLVIESVWNRRSTANILIRYWVKRLRYASDHSSESSADVKN